MLGPDKADKRPDKADKRPDKRPDKAKCAASSDKRQLLLHPAGSTT
jgi:hypothetical protein